MLVAGGASLVLEDRDGRTARHLALQSNDEELAAYLESKHCPCGLMMRRRPSRN
jgi:ankyrin repeat protein